MGLFSKNKEEKIKWKTLNQEEQLEEFIELSKNKPIAMFKHSTRCALSSMAKSRLERGWNMEDSDVDIYYLDLLNYRTISNRIASLFGVEHQSPQLIVLQDGKVLYHASHSEIEAVELKNALGK